jgi:WD40 repeat protein
VSPAGRSFLRVYAASLPASKEISLDGKTLAANVSPPLWQAGPQRAALWDVDTGRLLGETAGAGPDIDSLAFAPDGGRGGVTPPLLAVSQGGTTRLIEVATRKDLRKVRGGPAIFSPRGDLLATGSAEGDVTLWDPATGAEVRRLRGHRDHVAALAFSPDGKALASAAADRTVRLWDVAGGTETRPFAGHEHAVNAVAFAADGRTLTTWSRDGTVRLWDAATGRHLRLVASHSPDTSRSAHSPDGRVLAVASGPETIVLWDTETGRPLHTLEGHKGLIASLAFAPDGRTLASGSRRTEASPTRIASKRSQRTQYPTDQSVCWRTVFQLIRMLMPMIVCPSHSETRGVIALRLL